MSSGGFRYEHHAFQWLLNIEMILTNLPVWVQASL